VKYLAYTNGNSSFRRDDLKHGDPIKLGKVHKAGVNKISRRGHTKVADGEGLEVFLSYYRLDDQSKFKIIKVRNDTQLLKQSRNQCRRRLVLHGSK
jgi:hypothetical protein